MPHTFDCPLCLDVPICFDALICLEDVRMPPVHTQHKESMLCHTKGFLYAQYIWMSPYVWMASCMFECPHVWTPLYVWIMFGCPRYIHNTKKACFVTLRECPYAPIHLDAHCMFGCPSCLYTPICMNTMLYKHVGFSFCLICNEITGFLFNRIDFLLDHKLSLVQLTWLHLVYGKMFSLP